MIYETILVVYATCRDSHTDIAELIMYSFAVKHKSSSERRHLFNSPSFMNFTFIDESYLERVYEHNTFQC